MPEAKLIYDLPRETVEFSQAWRGSDMACALWEFSEHVLREYDRYPHDLDSADEAIARIRSEFHDILRERNLDLEELM